MSGILDLLQGPIGQQIISGVASSTGQDSNKTSGVLAMGLPLLMKAMQRNAGTTQGAQGIMGAMAKHAGSGLLDNLTGMFSGGVDEPVKQDGNKILNHVLGSKQEGISNMIGTKLGVDSGNVGSILSTAAPLLMGFLAKQSTQNGVSDANGLTSMIGGMLGGSETEGEQSFLEKMLDSDGDGSIMDDVAGMVTGNSGGSMLGGLLGNVLGGK